MDVCLSQHLISFSESFILVFLVWWQKSPNIKYFITIYPLNNLIGRDVCPHFKVRKLRLKELVAWLSNSGIPHCICLNRANVFFLLISLLLTSSACFRNRIMAVLNVFWFKLNLHVSNLPFPQIGTVMCYVDKTPKTWLWQTSSIWFSWSTKPGTWSGLNRYLLNGLYTPGTSEEAEFSCAGT